MSLPSDAAPAAARPRRDWLLGEYGMTLVLAALAVLISIATWHEQPATGPAAALELASSIAAASGEGHNHVVIVVRDTPAEQAWAETLRRELAAQRLDVVATISGNPAAAHRKLAELADAGAAIDFLACSPATFHWGIYDRLAAQQTGLRAATLIEPAAVRGSSFLTPANLLNIANQVAIIAIVAIGMTLVIITGGIDLSVGSLIALSAVVTTLAVRDLAGGTAASNFGLAGCALGAIGLCALVGMFSGAMVARFQIPSFITTLAMMSIASGVAYRISDGQSIDVVPERFNWLGGGTSSLGLPNAVLLMFGLYVAAQLVMTRSVLGRQVYAVGGNPEAARLSGVPVGRVLVVVYLLSGALAGLGGVVLASQLKSGAPTYGLMYELHVITAVVVGGTSLAGGEGRMLGTLVGAFIIAVIQNGMNLTGIESDTQKIVLGAAILAAVLLDRLKQRQRR
ncbi:MAG TPA: ABC transporter permease [Pirellulales bacterium]|nr:ABC transporter permease [Pirellulales bacterium]